MSFFVFKNGDVVGPFEGQHLIALWKSKMLDPGDLVQAGSSGDWVRLDSIVAGLMAPEPMHEAPADMPDSVRHHAPNPVPPLSPIPKKSLRKWLYKAHMKHPRTYVILAGVSAIVLLGGLYAHRTTTAKHRYISDLEEILREANRITNLVVNLSINH